MSNHWETIATETIHDNPYWKLRRDEYIGPNSSELRYWYIDTPGSVLVVAKISEDLHHEFASGEPHSHGDRFALVRQHRYLNNRPSLEFPGGGITLGSSAEESAIRELEEETGLKSKSLTKIAEFNPMVGATNETCFVFYCGDSIQSATKIDVSTDESEQIEVVALSEGEISEAIRSGEMWSGMSIAAWSFFQLFKNKVFL